MDIRVAQEITSDHAGIRRLVADGFDGIDVSGLEVHVQRARRSSESFSGRAYYRLPARPRPHPATRYLVRLKVPATLRNRGYPKTYRYWNRKTAPWITVNDWRERLVALAAHEACHVRQFREGTRRSEVEAERWAAARVQTWRDERSASRHEARRPAAQPRPVAVQLRLPLGGAAGAA